MASGWKFIISSLWVLTHPPIIAVKNISVNGMAGGWEFIISVLWVLMDPPITSAKNIIGKLKTLLSDCILM